jgi:cytochrome oxidase Cu insertion factor (SCO1/SenC/PrrC family)
MTLLPGSARRGGLVLFAALALGLSACSSAVGPAPPLDAGSGTAQEATAPTPLDFTGATLDGTTFDAATLAGTPVVLWFWAPF